MSTIPPEWRQHVLEMLSARYLELLLEQRQRGFSHKEAFCVMSYRDADGTYGTHVERLWNSRDGITPYCIESADGRELRHVDWYNDRRDPEHQPVLGERIFVDLDPVLCVALHERAVEREWDHAELPMREYFASQQEALERLTLGCYDSGIPPHVVTVTAELLRERGWDRRKPSSGDLMERARTAEGRDRIPRRGGGRHG
ncbi:MAG TPA: hypothetical protein VFG69_15280 [Nannocystaceae bacterium]|nr:hypothetical protein [Nannocystaceae bacterium]